MVCMFFGIDRVMRGTAESLVDYLKKKERD